MQTEILIVGAGAAGLAAAHELSSSGRDVFVIEARDRIGGRIWTLDDRDQNHPIELGAEFIHGHSPELFSIIKQSGLETSEVSAQNSYVENGQLVQAKEFWATLEDLGDRMKREIKDISFKSFLNTVPESEVSPTIRNAVIRYVEGFHAAEVNKIGIQGLVAVDEDNEQIAGDRTFRVLDGYRGIVNYLYKEAKAHGTVFRFETSAMRVRWRADEVEVQTNDLIIQANKVVVAIPLAVLKLKFPAQGAIEFLPSLPAEKLDAIKSLEVGAAVRIILQFNRQFWDEMRVSGTTQNIRQLGFLTYAKAPIPTWWTSLPDDDPMIVGWAGGPTATRLLALGDEEMKTGAIRSLAQIFNVTENRLQTYLVNTYYHDWLNDPYARGAYSYLPVNGIDDQLNLAKPVSNTLFFAGEATSPGQIGTVHGAVASGQRAAREILATESS